MKNIKQIIASIILTIVFSIGIHAQTFKDLENTDTDFNKIRNILQNELIGDNDLDSIKGWKQFKRWEWFWGQRLSKQNELPDAIEIKNEIKRFSPGNSKANNVQNVNWKMHGPFKNPNGANGVGRINDLELSPHNQNIMYVAAASGGIWYSSNGGESWTVRDMSEYLTIAISDIEVAPSNVDVVYAATGDANGTLGTGGSFYSIGVIKSTNRGETWKETNLTHSLGSKKTVTRVLVHPENENIVIASSSDGVFRTTDGGNNWEKTGSGVMVKDMEFKPNDHNIIYASTFNYSGNRLLRSTDNGRSWNTVKTFNGGIRTELAVSPDAPNNVYAVTAASHLGFLSFDVSMDSGQNWTKLADQNSVGNILGRNNGDDKNGGQGQYDLAIAVNPKNANEVYVGGINLWRSTNGGNGWSLYTHWRGGFEKPLVHADHHSLTFNPNGTILYSLNDGGINRNLPGTSTWESLNSGLNITQFYRMGISQTASGQVISGSQDNGTSMLTNNWRKVRGADGMECIIDPTNNSTFYASIYYGNIIKYKNNGTEDVKIIDIPTLNSEYNVDEAGAWVTPYLLDPSNSKTMYIGYKNVWKNTNPENVSTWQKLSNFGDNSNKALLSLAVASSNSNYIYAATSNSLYRTTNGGIDWENLHNSSISITYIAVDPQDPKKFYLTKSGYSNREKVLYYNGSKFIDLTGNLPALPVNTIAIDKSSNKSIYVGTDIGVFYSDLNSSHWVKLEGALPNTIINELEIHKSDKKLYAATYGRGIWSTDLLNCNSNKVEINKIGELEFCEGDSVILEVKGDYNKYLWSTGERKKRITVKESGKYYLTIPNGNYCMDKSDIISVNVKNVNEININKPDNDVLCGELQEIRLVAPFGIKDFQWSTGESTRVIKVTEPGLYSLTAINSNDCEVNDTIEVFKSEIPQSPKLIQDRDKLVAPKKVASDFYYKWYFEGELIEEGVENELEIEQLGEYKVEISDDLGCTVETGTVDVVTSVEESEYVNLLRVFPNPNEGIFNLEFQDNLAGEVSFEIIDNLGRVIIDDSSQSIKSGSLKKFDISKFGKGTYILKIKIGSDQIIRKVIHY